MEQVLDSPSEERKIIEYAGFWIRTAALIIDAIILAVVQWMVSYLFLTSGAFSFTALQAVNIVIGLAYVTILESSSKQGTVGKMAVGIKVGDVDGDQISWLNALGRYLSKFISFIILCIGFIMVAFDDKKQGLHDKIASTYVFYSK